jgi:hypothetical protein
MNNWDLGMSADCRNKKGLSVGSGDMIEGFCGISRRRGMNPLIAAVNGYAFGKTYQKQDGLTLLKEVVLRWWSIGNSISFTFDVSDLVIASTKASFALPEVKRGVFAKAGALGRIIRFLGTPSSFFKSDCRFTKGIGISVNWRPHLASKDARMGCCERNCSTRGTHSHCNEICEEDMRE